MKSTETIRRGQQNTIGGGESSRIATAHRLGEHKGQPTKGCSLCELDAKYEAAMLRQEDAR